MIQYNTCSLVYVRPYEMVRYDDAFVLQATPLSNKKRQNKMLELKSYCVSTGKKNRKKLLFLYLYIYFSCLHFAKTSKNV